MKSPHRKYLLILVVVITILSFACDVPSDDPRIPPNISPYLSIFTEYIGYLKALPEGQIPIPIILEPKPPITTPTIATFSGFSPNQSDLNSTNPPVINLYTVRPNGCDGEIIRGELLGTVTLAGENDISLDSRKWTIEDVELKIESLFVAATITVDGSEGDYSEIMILNPQNVMPIIIGPNPENPVPPKISISGQAYPGFCLSIYRSGSLIKDIDIPYSVEEPMKIIDWSTGVKTEQLISIKDDSTKNKFLIIVKGYDIPSIDLNYSLDSPNFQWPFGSDVEGLFQADEKMSCVTAWSGTNDFHISLHSGIDLNCITTVPNKYVRAVSEGVVYYAKFDSIVGNSIAIDHGSFVTLYWHLEKIDEKVKKGEPVKQGQIIGLMGSTGKYSTGPHLHFQSFWWGDILTKEKFKTTPYTPVGATLINPNAHSLNVCPGPKDLWLINWAEVKIIDEYDGTNFETCTEKENCKCPGQ